MGNVEWAHIPGTLRDGSKALWRWGISLYGSFVKGTWREGYLAEDPGEWVEKALEIGISIGAPLGYLEGGSSTRDFERWMKEALSRNGAFLSEEAQCGGPLGKAPFLGSLEDMLTKAPDMGISLHRAPLCPRGTWNQEGGSYTGDFE